MPETPAERPEVCICAALKLANGYIIRGHRHDDCIKNAIARKAEADGHIQGFLTTHERFVTRQQGARLQRAAGRVSVNTGAFTDFLFSEDLY
jgi:hypothetical protein